MKTALLPIYALLVSVAFLLMTNGLLWVLLPMRALLQDFTPIDFGIMGAAYFIGFGTGCLIGPLLVRRAGHIRTFAAMASIVSCLILIHALFEGKIVWWLARAATGFCFAALYLVIESWLNEKSSNEDRGLVFSAYTIIKLTVITLGLLAATLSNPQGFSLFALAAILVSLSTVPVAMSTTTAPAPLVNIHVRITYLFQRSHVGVVGCLGVGLVNGAFWTLAPLFAQREDPTDIKSVAFFMSVSIIAGAVGQWPLGRLSDHFDRRRIIIAACVGAILGSISLIVVPEYLPGWIFIGSLIYGAFAFSLYALCAAHLNDFVESDGFVEAASGLLLIYAVGAIIGPVFASALMHYFGPGSLFFFNACIHLFIAGYAIYRIRRSAPAVERASYAAALVLTSMSGVIEPHSQTGVPPVETRDDNADYQEPEVNGKN